MKSFTEEHEGRKDTRSKNQPGALGTFVVFGLALPIGANPFAIFAAFCADPFRGARRLVWHARQMKIVHRRSRRSQRQELEKPAGPLRTFAVFALALSIGANPFAIFAAFCADPFRGARGSRGMRDR